VAISDEQVTGRAFAELADRLIVAVNKRNQELPKTRIVQMLKR